MLSWRSPLRALSVAFALCATLEGCGDDSEPTANEEFFERATGTWRTLLQLGEGDMTVFAVDEYYFTEPEQTISVEAFFDSDLTKPFLRYEASLTAERVERSMSIEDGYELDLRTDSATMTALVDEPELFAAFGLDDCGLAANEEVDVSGSACGVPVFRDASCVEKELYQVGEKRDEFRVGVITDKCTARPSEIDADQVYALVDADSK